MNRLDEVGIDLSSFLADSFADFNTRQRQIWTPNLPANPRWRESPSKACLPNRNQLAFG